MTKESHRPKSWFRLAKLRVQAAAMISIPLMVTALGTRAQAEPMKEMMTMCTYGVLAGTLVGAATLAFTDKPGDNLNYIARGASLGLYAGILLGAYVVYGVPSEDSEGYQEPTGEGVPGQEAPPPEENEGASRKIPKTGPEYSFRPTIFPLFTAKNGIEGVGVILTPLRF